MHRGDQISESWQNRFNVSDAIRVFHRINVDIETFRKRVLKRLQDVRKRLGIRVEVIVFQVDDQIEKSGEEHSKIFGALGGTGRKVYRLKATFAHLWG